MTKKVISPEEHLRILNYIDSYRDEIPTDYDPSKEKGFIKYTTTKSNGKTTRSGQSITVLNRFMFNDSKDKIKAKLFIRFDDTGFKRSSWGHEVSDPWYPSIGGRVCRGKYDFDNENKVCWHVRKKLYDLIQNLPESIVVSPRWRILSNIMNDIVDMYGLDILKHSNLFIRSSDIVSIDTLRVVSKEYYDVDISGLEVDRSKLLYKDEMPEFTLDSNFRKLKAPHRIPTNKLHENYDAAREQKGTQGGDYYVLGYIPIGKYYNNHRDNKLCERNDYIILFKDTGFITRTEALNIGVKDPWYPTTQGIACLGDLLITDDPKYVSIRKRWNTIIAKVGASDESIDIYPKWLICSEFIKVVIKMEHSNDMIANTNMYRFKRIDNYDGYFPHNTHIIEWNNK